MYHHHSFVTLSHTDAAGVTYFAAYYILAHQIYEHFLFTHQLGLRQWLDQMNLPIVHSEASYQAPLFLGDPLCISMGTTKVGKHSFKLRYQFRAWQNQQWVKVADVHTAHVAVENGQATSLPSSLLELLAKLGEFQDEALTKPPPRQ